MLDSEKVERKAQAIVRVLPILFSPLISLIPRHSFLSWLIFSLGGKNHKDSSPPTSEMTYEPGLQVGDQNFRVVSMNRRAFRIRQHGLAPVPVLKGPSGSPMSSCFPT